jgi:hypothetical protein
MRRGRFGPHLPPNRGLLADQAVSQPDDRGGRTHRHRPELLGHRTDRATEPRVPIGGRSYLTSAVRGVCWAFGVEYVLVGAL